MPEATSGNNFMQQAQRLSSDATHKSTSGSHFGLFEPCHWGLGNSTPPDQYDDDMRGDCGRIMDKLVQCDFSHVKFLFGWSRYSGPHTDISGINVKQSKYTPEKAMNSCKSS